MGAGIGNPVREKAPVTQREMIAYFPDAWTYATEYLKDSFHDVPNGEPELTQGASKSAFIP